MPSHLVCTPNATPMPRTGFGGCSTVCARKMTPEASNSLPGTAGAGSELPHAGIIEYVFRIEKLRCEHWSARLPSYLLLVAAPRTAEDSEPLMVLGAR